MAQKKLIKENTDNSRNKWITGGRRCDQSSKVYKQEKEGYNNWAIIEENHHQEARCQQT